MNYYPDANNPNTTSRNNLKLTKDGIHHVMLSKNNPAVGRIQPSFDFSLSTKDEAFKNSFVPYRDQNLLSDQGIPMFRSWFFFFFMHTYLGVNKHFYVSPRVRKEFNPSASAIECYDPVEEMFWKIRRNDTAYMHLRKLVVKPQGSTEVVNLPLANAKRCAVMNFFGTLDPKNENSNFLLVMSEGGMNMTKALLDEAGLRSQQPRDMNWQDFLFGDVTDPATGLLARHTTKIAAGTNERGIATNTLAFSSGDKTLADSRVVQLDAAALSTRYNFFDIENIWNIPSAQTIVDRLVDDGEIPLEFMKEICGNMCDFPSKEATKFDSGSTSLPPENKVAPVSADPGVPQSLVQNTPQTQTAPQQQQENSPTAAETDAEFAIRIDREVELAKATDPSVNFVSILKENALIMRYLSGKK